MLDKQIHCLLLDTCNFYSNSEAFLHNKLHRIRYEKRQLSDIKKKITAQIKNEKDDNQIDILNSKIKRIDSILQLKRQIIAKTEEKMLTKINNKQNEMRQMRTKVSVKNYEITSAIEIAVFDGILTRTLGVEPDTFTDDFMVIQVYYHNIMQNLINNGFTYKGEKYIFLTASAGQIRQKKIVFIKESVWLQHEKTLMCGLTLDKINALGGNNPNKHLAYTALISSATDVWEEFDIDKSIVIDDFETDVEGIYDFIDETNYSITRKTGKVPVPHTDGAGMILPNAFGKQQVNMMVRLPFIKGLIALFDYRKFIEVNNCSPIIKDIYGVEHDVIAEDIQVIFTKSQFKMWKFYKNWEDYKDNYKKYHCTAGYTNPEEERIKDTKINYQMLQTLTDVTDEELEKIAKPSVDTLNNLCSSIDNIKRFLGITPYNTNMNSLQKSIKIYPNLINDAYIKQDIYNRKNHLVREFKSGKLQIHGKYTFVLPDFYAACQHWFCAVKNPKGLLADGEVFCWLFRKDEKLDCLRSPHLYKEHAVRKNLACNSFENKQKQLREWFCTNAVYTSCHDLITKICMNDCDGDKYLLVGDKFFVEIAERNMKDIVPLYYNMKKAPSTILNNNAFFNGLKTAFKYSNIGIYSNNITKIWNSEVFINGTEEEKQKAIDTVKLLCLENNFCIDAAKTLYMPERPKQVTEQISYYTKSQVPHFFKYAKDKDNSQVAPINNSIVNRLDSIIPNPRLNFKKLDVGKVDYRLLMKNPDIKFAITVNKNGQLIENGTEPLVFDFCQKSKTYHFDLDSRKYTYEKDIEKLNAVKKKLQSDIAKQTKEEMLKYGYSKSDTVDILVKYFYGFRSTTKHKTLLWNCYGDVIYENLIYNLSNKNKTKIIQCEDCGELIEVNKHSRATRCVDCQKIIHNKKHAIQQKIYRNKIKSSCVSSCL